MDLKFKVFAHVSRPVAEVFEAVVDPAKLSNYFTTGGAQGRLETGATVIWDFHDFPGAFPVEVVEVIDNKKIVLRWDANDKMDDGSSYKTEVTIEFEPLDGDSRTKVSISEEGWRETGDGLTSSYGNCMGWSQVLAALKMWVEYGINLREGMYK
jgi:uncharacterized protein YndB with AHSA1/START domain